MFTSINFFFFFFFFILFVNFLNSKKNGFLYNIDKIYINKIKENKRRVKNMYGFKNLNKIKKMPIKHISLLFVHNKIKIIKSFKLYIKRKIKIKPKTNQSIAKRFKITKNGKLIRKKAGRNHNLRKKTSSNKSSLRQRTTIGSNRIARKYKSVIFK